MLPEGTTAEVKKVPGTLNLMLAAGAMAFSSGFVVSNSLRVRGQKIQ